MTVIQTIASLAPETGGPARTVPSLCKALGDHSVTAKILSMDGKSLSTPRTTSVETQVIPRRRFLGRPLGVAQFKQALTVLVRSSENCIIHDNGLWLATNHAVAVVSRGTKTSLLVTPHGMLEPWAFNHKRWKKKLAWKVYQRRNLETAIVLHATSEMEARNLRALGLRQPIAVIPNGVDLPAAEVARPAPTSERRTVLFLSRVHEKKGLLHLVEAWAALRPAGWRVVVAGPDEGGYRRVIEEAVTRAGLEEQFCFVGPIDDADKWDFYRQADLFVLPTMSENFGIVVPEALACGTPVITTKGAPWAELETHRCGWWIDVGTSPLVDALRDAMSRSDAERRAMGERGRLLVEAQYTWEGVAGEMRAVYKWMLGSGSLPDCVQGSVCAGR